MLLTEALDELQRTAVGHQVQRTLALMVGVVDVSPLLCEKASDGCADTDLVVSQKARSVQLWIKKEDDAEMNREKNQTLTVALANNASDCKKQGD